MSIAIWWVRRDLRLVDNQALHAATRYAEQVIPVFVLDPQLLSAPDLSDKRLGFLVGGLRDLDKALRAIGSRLIIRRGQPLAELRVLLNETGATRIYAEDDPWPYGRERDRGIAADLPLQLTEGLTLHPLGSIRKATDGGPYRVFTPFKHAWRALPMPRRGDLLPAPARLVKPSGIKSLAIPQLPVLPAQTPFPPGEMEAKERLDTFVSGENAAIGDYADQRNRVDLDGTSRLSPYLRFGMVSTRQAVTTALAASEGADNPQYRAGADSWLTELIWREFYMTILHHFPRVLNDAFRANLRHIKWHNDKEDFEAWCTGRTGYPVIDAAMRQLTSTGWMHNRARMFVASFLVKDLLINWQWGERFFLQHLIDGEPAANNGGWQWTAGVGTDAAPYFRIFNPTSQGKKFDPDGQYVRRWVGELADVPQAFIHEPWRMTGDTQRFANCILGQDYPFPIVDHAWARQRTLTAYGIARDTTSSA